MPFSPLKYTFKILSFFFVTFSLLAFTLNVCFHYVLFQYVCKASFTRKTPLCVKRAKLIYNLLYNSQVALPCPATLCGVVRRYRKHIVNVLEYTSCLPARHTGSGLSRGAHVSGREKGVDEREKEGESVRWRERERERQPGMLLGEGFGKRCQAVTVAGRRHA